MGRCGMMWVGMGQLWGTVGLYGTLWDDVGQYGAAMWQLWGTMGQL